MKSLLFISAIDFKEKSIQVIRKTPEAYVKEGWSVDYIVARDNSKYGNYYYEEVVNPHGVNVHRISIPLTILRDKIHNTTLRNIVYRFAFYFAVIKLALNAKKILQKKSFNIIYGYEIFGVLAISLLRLLGRLDPQIKIVHRFQGTWCYEYLKNKNFKKLIINLDSCIALRQKSDLCIMTNDGTSGDKAMMMLHSKSLKNLKFLVNGVDNLKIDNNTLKHFITSLNLTKKNKVAVSICRLEQWKRIDRAILAVNKAIKEYHLTDFIYYIVGDGNERQSFEKLVEKLEIKKNVIFVGAIQNKEVKKYLQLADIFFSTNDLSNVGNPLLEAIRANKIIFTLNNGDTGSWIQHRSNGFLYNIDNKLIDNMAKDIYEVLKNSKLKMNIINKIRKTEKEKLWTWEQRFETEIKEVTKLFKK